MHRYFIQASFICNHQNAKTASINLKLFSNIIEISRPHRYSPSTSSRSSKTHFFDIVLLTSILTLTDFPTLTQNFISYLCSMLLVLQTLEVSYIHPNSESNSKRVTQPIQFNTVYPCWQNSCRHFCNHDTAKLLPVRF